MVAYGCMQQTEHIMTQTNANRVAHLLHRDVQRHHLLRQFGRREVGQALQGNRIQFRSFKRLVRPVFKTKHTMHDLVASQSNTEVFSLQDGQNILGSLNQRCHLSSSFYLTGWSMQFMSYKDAGNKNRDASHGRTTVSLHSIPGLQNGDSFQQEDWSSVEMPIPSQKQRKNNIYN